jgi:hypothetical protein
MIRFTDLRPGDYFSYGELDSEAVYWAALEGNSDHIIAVSTGGERRIFDLSTHFASRARINLLVMLIPQESFLTVERMLDKRYTIGGGPP